MSDLRIFHNRLRKLLNIDMSELVSAGVIAADDTMSWKSFQDDPFIFFIRCDDQQAERVWSIMGGEKAK